MRSLNIACFCILEEEVDLGHERKEGSIKQHRRMSPISCINEELVIDTTLCPSSA